VENELEVVMLAAEKQRKAAFCLSGLVPGDRQGHLQRHPAVRADLSSVSQ
jgi:hypothetical protein